MHAAWQNVFAHRLVSATLRAFFLGDQRAEVCVTSRSPNGYLLAIGCRDGAIHVRSLFGGRSFTMLSHLGPVHSLAWSPCSRKLISSSKNARDTVQFWDADRGTQLSTSLRGFYPKSPNLAWSPNGSYVATCSDRIVKVWDASSGVEIHGFATSHGTDFVLWSSDSVHLALVSMCEVRMYVARTGRECPIVRMRVHSSCVLPAMGTSMVLSALDRAGSASSLALPMTSARASAALRSNTTSRPML